MAQGKYKENLSRFIDAKQKARDAQRKRLFDSLGRIVAEALVVFPQLNRVVLVGSVASGGFSDDSDVDLVVSGIDRNDYFRLHSFLENKLKRRVDLIMEEDLGAEERRHILKKQEVVYDKTRS